MAWQLTGKSIPSPARVLGNWHVGAAFIRRQKLEQACGMRRQATVKCRPARTWISGSTVSPKAKATVPRAEKTPKVMEAGLPTIE